MVQISVNREVRFKRPWRGRGIGDTDAGLPHGIAQTLIDYGIAEVVQDAKGSRPKPVTAPPRSGRRRDK